MQDKNTRQYFEAHRKFYWSHFEHKCYNCESTTDALELHHIIPLSLGGTNNPTNMVPLCERCHGLIHGMPWKLGHAEATKRGIEKARREGKQIGGVEGKKLTTKKSIKSKELIRKYSKDFDGSLTDKDTMKLIGIARNSYYKYKKELKNEIDNNKE